jgi:hypothetical protein
MTEAEPRAIPYRALGDASGPRHRVPLVIGVTGHRDPRDEDIEGNRSHPQAFQAAGFAGIMGSVRLARAAAMRLQA